MFRFVKHLNVECVVLFMQKLTEVEQEQKLSELGFFENFHEKKNLK